MCVCSFLFTVPYLLHNGASPSTIVDHGGNFETWNFRQFSTRIFLPSSREELFILFYIRILLFSHAFSSINGWMRIKV